MDTKRLREILEKYREYITGSLIGDGEINGITDDQAIKEIQELSTPRLTDWEKVLPKKFEGITAILDKEGKKYYEQSQLAHGAYNQAIDDCLSALKSISEPRLPEPHIVDSVVVYDTAYSEMDIKRLLNELMIYKRDKPRLMEECQCEKPLTDNYNSECFHCGKTLRDATCTGKKPSVREKGLEELIVDLRERFLSLLHTYSKMKKKQEKNT